MHDERVMQSKQAVDRYLLDHPGFNFANPKHFPRLVADVRHAMNGDEGAAEPEDELHCVVAMCALGPLHSLPPQTMREQLLGIIREFADGNSERVLEFAVAYGCGKWRSISPRPNTWEGRWDGAFLTVVRVIESATRTCNQWLAPPHLVGYPSAAKWRSDEGKAFISSDAHLLALSIVNPVTPLHIKQNQELRIHCTEDGTGVEVSHGSYSHFSPPGAKWVFETTESSQLQTGAGEISILDPGTRVMVSTRDAEVRITSVPTMRRVTLKTGETATIDGPVTLRLWSCGCGHVKCAERHRLNAWNPNPRVTLWSYLTSAIKGPQVNIQSGSFMAGMYYPLLATDGNGYSMRVRLAPVEYKLCSNDACKDPKTLMYEGDKCLQCNTHFDPKTTRKKAFDRLIVQTDYEIYELQARLHCKECDNLFSSAECSICGCSPRLRRPTHVWVRRFSSRFSLDDDDVNWKLDAG